MARDGVFPRKCQMNKNTEEEAAAAWVLWIILIIQSFFLEGVEECVQ